MLPDGGRAGEGPVLICVWNGGRGSECVCLERREEEGESENIVCACG